MLQYEIHFYETKKISEFFLFFGTIVSTRIYSIPIRPLLFAIVTASFSHFLRLLAVPFVCIPHQQYLAPIRLNIQFEVKKRRGGGGDKI